MNDITVMSNIQLPEIAKKFAGAFDTSATTYASTQYPFISIKGKVFTLRKGDEEVVLMNPNDKSCPSNYIHVVVVLRNPNKSHSYYAGAYDPTLKNLKPTCFSNDGIVPDASVDNPQCNKCELCQRNVYKPDASGSRHKECSDSVRIAVAAPTDLDTVFMMRIPPASITAFGDYIAALASHNLPYQAIVTRISFDPKVATPKLEFRAVEGLKSEADIQKVLDQAKSDLVKKMLGVGTIPIVPATPAPAPARVTANVRTSADAGRVSEANERQQKTTAVTDTFIAEAKAEIQQRNPQVAKDDGAVKVVNGANELEAALGDLGSGFMD